MTIFLLNEKFILLKDKKSAIYQKAKNDFSKLYHQKVIIFFEDHLDKKEEDDYGVKELAKIDKKTKK